MTTTKPKTRSATSSSSNGKAAIKSSVPPGYVPDAVFDRVRQQLRTMTPAQFRRHLVKCGIIDKQGGRIGPAE